MNSVKSKRLDNCILNAQKISASNGEWNNNSTVLAKKTRSIYNTPCANPLNRHGNTFQGLPKSNASTRPGFIRNLGDEQRRVNNVVKYQGDPIYNPLNKHGNAFQGFSASMKREPEAVRDVFKRNSIDIGLDNNIFEKYKLFPVTSEAEMQVAPVNHEDDIEPITFKDNKPYYQIAF